jgi:putative oxidoreductase
MRHKGTSVNTIRRARLQDVTHSLLRFVAGLLFWFHGAQKLFGWFSDRPRVPLASLLGVAGNLEFFGGLLIAFGLLTHPVAFILAGEMAVAYFMAHQPGGTWPIQNRGELAVLYCFIMLFLAANGPGSYSLDALMRRRRRTAPAGELDRA